MVIKRLNRKGQEEMVGFALIMVIVAVILLIFLGFAIRKPQIEAVENYEVGSFLQAMLQYTSNCEDNLESLDIQKLISRCDSGSVCLDGRNTCDALESSLEEIIGDSWPIVDRPQVGYIMNISSESSEFLIIDAGNITNSFKGATQRLPNDIDINFKVYF